MPVIKKATFRKRVHLFPNIITAFGLSCGLFVIFKMALTDVNGTNTEVLLQATIFLLIAGVADLLDGTVARLIHAESDFGVFFDSIADSITFGVAPAVIALKSIPVAQDGEPSFALSTSAMIFSLCGVLRLVRYSVQSNQIKDDEVKLAAYKKNFTGLPIPAAGAAVVSANLFLASEDCQQLMTINMEGKTAILTTIMVLLGYFMISRWKFPSLKALHLRVQTFQLVLITVLIAALLFYGILHHFPLVFVSVSWGYVVIAWILSVIRLIAGRKSKTLEDFEPEPEKDEFES